ncbi:MAG: peptidoglycan bridge formation glycyltransferase FemA/FemB family protein [Oscillospiraceae bacterium]|nr:peptidoglycan bridge formation glycyltransferase FemA/FemB family protein [Oscillospiraceae bacterium]
MVEFVTKETLKEYEAFVSSHSKGHFLQSYAWSKQKPEWIWEGFFVRNEDGNICGAMSVLIRRVPHLPYSIMYGARAPVCDIHDADVLAELMEGAKQLAAKYKAYCLKLDPDVSVNDTEFADIMSGLGFNRRDTGKNFSGIQPRFVFRLDIDGKSEDELMSSFHSKTRYNIRVAERKGVEVRTCGKEAVGDFSEMMLETGVRDNFVVRNREYFENMLDNLGSSCRLYMAYSGETPIAGTLAVHYGDKVWYLYGASSNKYRNFMPNYLLQWSMIQWAVSLGCKLYDFRGVSGDLDESNPLYGLYRFKKGFNGDLVEFHGEFEYIFNKPLNFAIEKGELAYRKLRKKLFILKNKK